MKKNVLKLAFVLAFASMSVLADDGETGHGGKTPDPVQTPAARSTQSTTSPGLLDQILDVIYVAVAQIVP
jgi:hypothetical protein